MNELIELAESIFYEVNRLCDTADLLEQCDRERDEFINQSEVLRRISAFQRESAPPL